MQLTYRGVSFSSLIAGMPSIETEQTALFLGKRYKLKQSCIAFQQPAEDLIYRGVRYSR